MGSFSYKAMDKTGKIRMGNVEEKNRADAAEHLRGMGLTPLEIRVRSIWNTDLSDLSMEAKVNKSELSLFCGQLSFALGAGLSLSRAFEVLCLHGFSSSRRLREASRGVSELLQKGESLSEALDRAKVFPPLLVAMTNVGERSGTLDIVMDRLAKYYEKEHKIYSEIINALIYPALVSLLMLGVIVLALVFVLPRYAEMFLSADIELPLPTRALMAVSGFVVQNYVLIIIAATLLLFGCRMLLRLPAGKTARDWLLLNLPPASVLYRKTLNLRFVQALSIMTDSGMEITSALNAARGVFGNKILEQSLSRVITQMHSGGNLGDCIGRINYFDELLPTMIGMAEESGTMPEMLKKCADYLQEETEASLSRMSKLIEPAITIFMGAILAFVMMSVMLPTFYITDMI